MYGFVSILGFMGLFYGFVSTLGFMGLCMGLFLVLGAGGQLEYRFGTVSRLLCTACVYYVRFCWGRTVDTASYSPF